MAFSFLMRRLEKIGAVIALACQMVRLGGAERQP